jgi:cytochrome b561
MPMPMPMHTASSLPPPAFGMTAISLHWLMALTIFTTFGLGLFMTKLPLSPDKLRYYSWHKWVGVSIFLLAAFRLVWRLVHVTPEAPVQLPRWQRTAARWMHRLLYLLMFAVPLSGWLMSSAKGVTTVYLGVWPLPDVLSRNAELGRQLQTLHMSLNYLMASMVGVHALAALKHRFAKSSGHNYVLHGMLP